MFGLILKDLLVFEKRFNKFYRFVAIIILAGVIILLPSEGARYIAIMLPMMGIAFLAEITKVEEKSDWRDYLPALPITSREIVLSRYLFCGLLLAVFSAMSFILCVITSVHGGFPLGTIMHDYVLGVWLAVLMLCFGIPAGYFYKNEVCTGAMIGCCIIIGIIRNTGLDTLFFSLATPTISIIALFATVLIAYISYRVALWIFTTKRYKIRLANAKTM